MKNKVKILPILAMIISVSCISEFNNKETSIAIDEKEMTAKVKLSDGSFFNEIKKDTIIAYDLGKYMEYAYPTDYIAGLSSSNLNPLGKEFIYGYSQPYVTCVGSKSNSLEKNGLFVNVNDICLNILPDTKSEVKRADLESMFGTKVRYDIYSSISTKGAESETIEIYAPEIIKFLFPKIEKEEDLYPLFYYKSFPIQWNEDPNNPNGIMVIVEWTGTMIYGEDHPDAYVRSTDLISDTGEAFLNPAMFNDIPDTALCTLTILRGDVANVLVNNYSCKLTNSTHQSIQFILIKNVIENESND